MDLDRLAPLAGRTWTSEPLAHRRAEPVVRVRTADGREPVLDLVVRRVGPARGLRLDGEGEATVAAARLGVGPRVAAWQPQDGLLAVEHVVGRHPTAADLRDPATLTRLAAALRRLHRSGVRFGQDLDLFAEARAYPALAEDPLLARLEAALAVRPEPAAPCHNDVVPGNIIDDGTRVWLVDFEYAGNGEPSAELAGLVIGAELTPADVPSVAAAYDGEPTRRRVARILLWRVVQLLLWSEWARAVASDSWAERLASARDAAVADPRLEEYVAEAARPDRRRPDGA